MSAFASDGFDVSSSDGDVVHEIGGAQTKAGAPAPPSPSPEASHSPEAPDTRPLHAKLKAEGNELFKAGDYGGALELYMEAISEGEKSCEEGGKGDGEGEGEGGGEDGQENSSSTSPSSPPSFSFGEDLLNLLQEHKEYEAKKKAVERRVKEEKERQEERKKAREERGEVRVRVQVGGSEWGVPSDVADTPPPPFSHFLPSPYPLSPPTGGQTLPSSLPNP
jgi:hypothetical protein